MFIASITWSFISETKEFTYISMNDNQGTITTMKHEENPRLVLFPLPFQGHINPMFQLANMLQARGFTISIIHTRFKFPDSSKYPHFTFHVIPDGLSKAEESSTDPLLLISRINANCAEPLQKLLDELMSEYHIQCFITDTNWYCSQAVADYLKLPRIVIRTASVSSFLAFAALSELRDKGYFSGQESMMEELVPELPPLKVKDLPVIQTSIQDDLYKYTHKMVEESKKASGLIFNTFKELEGPDLSKLSQEFAIPTFSIGPFHKRFSAATSSLITQDMSTITWLDKQEPKSVLYVSFGSVAILDAKKLEEVAWGLVNSEQPFLWAIRPGIVQGSDWLENLPNGLSESIKKRGYVVKWAPQQEVLMHPSVAGFWTHSGWNSTLESICEGVPMICSPFLGDQMVNSRYTSDVWKIGIKLEKGLERGEIENAIRKLMVDEEGEEMRKRVTHLKEIAESCLNVGGSSHQSLDDLVNFISSLRSLTT